MRVFVTGATGFIGSAVVQELLGAGHEVVGLARSDAGAKSLVAAGARAHRGRLDDLKSLRGGASSTEGVIHLAFIHDIGHATFRQRLRILVGGLPRGIVSRFAATITEADGRAIETLGSALAGSGRPLVVAFPTMGLTAGRLATEEDAADPNSVGGARVPSEEATVAMVSRGVRASVVRLPPSVHGDGDHGLVWSLIGTARKKGASASVDNGSNRWPAVHRLDAAKLFRLALEKGSAGARYHAVAEEGIPFREIAEVIGQRLNVPVVTRSPGEAAGFFSFLAPFVAADNPVSSALTRKLLGWRPAGPGLIEDLREGRYFEEPAGRGSPERAEKPTVQPGVR